MSWGFHCIRDVDKVLPGLMGFVTKGLFSFRLMMDGMDVFCEANGADEPIGGLDRDVPMCVKG